MFDYDKKIISYVHLNRTWQPKKNEKKQEKNENDNNKIGGGEDGTKNFGNIKDIILIILLIIILLIVGIIFGIFLGKRIWNKKQKLEANELEEENYQYIPTNKKEEEIGMIN